MELWFYFTMQKTKSSQEIRHTLITVQSDITTDISLVLPLFWFAKPPKNFEKMLKHFFYFEEVTHWGDFLPPVKMLTHLVWPILHGTCFTVFCNKSADIATIQNQHMSNIYSQLTRISHYDNILLGCRGQILCLCIFSKTHKIMSNVYYSTYY